MAIVNKFSRGILGLLLFEDILAGKVEPLSSLKIGQSHIWAEDC
jgi:hypothetical protein